MSQNPLPTWVEEIRKVMALNNSPFTEDSNRLLTALEIAWKALGWIEKDAKGVDEATEWARKALQRIAKVGGEK